MVCEGVEQLVNALWQSMYAKVPEFLKRNLLAHHKTLEDLKRPSRWTLTVNVGDWELAEEGDRYVLETVTFVLLVRRPSSLSNRRDRRRGRTSRR